MTDIHLRSQLNILSYGFHIRLPGIKLAAVWIICLLVGLAGCSDLSYGPEEVLSVELTTAPGIGVEVIPVHESLSEKHLSSYDVDDEGMVVVVAGGSLYDLVTGKQLSQPDIHVTSVALVLGNLVVTTSEDQIGIWGEDGIEDLTSLPLSEARVAPGTTGEFLVWGETVEGDHALVSFNLEGPPRFISGSPLPILTAAASSQQAWFSIEETLFSLTESGNPELVLALPDEKSLITGVALSGGRKYFSTSDTVYLLQEVAALPLVIGIGGQLRAAAGGIFVLDDRLGHLYRIVAGKSESAPVTAPVEPASAEDEDSSSALTSPSGDNELTSVIFSLSKSHIAAYILLALFLFTVDKATRTSLGDFLLCLTGILITWEILAFQLKWQSTALWCLGSLTAFLFAVFIGRSLLGLAKIIISHRLPRWVGWILFVPAAASFLAGIVFVIVFGHSWIEYLIIYVFTFDPKTLTGAAEFEMPSATFATIAGFLTSYASWVICAAVIKHSSRWKPVVPVSAESDAAVHRVDRRKVLRPICWQCRKRVKTDNRALCVVCGRIVHRSLCSIKFKEGIRYCRTCYDEWREQDEPESSGTDPVSSTDEDSKVSGESEAREDVPSLKREPTIVTSDKESQKFERNAPKLSGWTQGITSDRQSDGSFDAVDLILTYMEALDILYNLPIPPTTEDPGNYCPPTLGFGEKNISRNEDGSYFLWPEDKTCTLDEAKAILKKIYS